MIFSQKYSSKSINIYQVVIISRIMTLIQYDMENSDTRNNAKENTNIRETEH